MLEPSAGRKGGSTRGRKQGEGRGHEQKIGGKTWERDNTKK